uniref:Uncharacterized protein n=1 Tax=Anguilla anguilla TaxID=7936 RepID=A0A0E9TG72_ANGAN
MSEIPSRNLQNGNSTS